MNPKQMSINLKIKNITIPLLILIMIAFFLCAQTEESDMLPPQVIWYKQAARIWEEALPVGNGRIGAMVFGKTSNERIQLNDDSLWPAEVGWDEPDGNVQDLNLIRELLFVGKAQEADKLIIEKFSRKDIRKSHQTLGELFIGFDHSNITEYRRELNLSNATATVSYKTDGHLFTQTVFASHPHQVIVVRITTESPEGMNGKIHMERPEDMGFSTATVTAPENNLLIMSGEVTQRNGVFDSKPFPVLEGVKFETRLKIDHTGGEIIAGDGYLEMNGAKEATLYLVSNSSFYHEDFSAQNQKDLEEIQKFAYQTILDQHIADHAELYSRVSLQLAGNELDSVPTDERIQQMKNGEQDLALESILFQYGRYLLIGSSRQGTNPANLQGLWNQHIQAPWNADYHLNINLQMNYWLADVTNLGELNQPLFDYVDKLVENGKITAAKNFGCRGSFIPHASDLWASTWLQARMAYWGSSFGAGGWLMQHYWEHFRFNLDTTFLEQRAFPAMHEVAQFYSDWLIEDPRDGTLIAAPGTSPENLYLDSNGNQSSLCLGTAMDQQIVAEVFDNYIKTCQVLNLSNPLLDTILLQRKQLRDGFVLGSDGRILEWDREYAENEPGHRHISHLYGFHPGTSVTLSENPELFDAVRKTLDYRLANGGAGTGWSRAWLINCAARLFDGEMAHEHIRFFFTNSMYDNLFCSHPPYQIDGNFGFTAGIAEMLIQSHEENTLRILPALPIAWKDGSVKGLIARGSYEIDIDWKEGLLNEIVIDAQKPGMIKLVYQDKMMEFEYKAGKNKITADHPLWKTI
jgi:alpha-L-fucosidase 2